MVQSVSNDALWEKLSEMEKKLDGLAVMQKSQDIAGEKDENMSGFDGAKDAIITEIRQQTALLGKHNDSNFGANRENIQLLNKNILLVSKHIRETEDRLKIYVESQEGNEKSCFNFKMFKVRKTSFVITILGLLVFLLTLFCMKQQNDYALLIEEHHRQGIVIERQKPE